MKTTRRIGQLILALTVLGTLQVRAEEAAADAARTSDKLNIDKLEEKYWSVKDDDFTVVQNRAFTKAKRFFASLQTGRLINDGFSEGTPTGVSLGYYQTEHLGYSFDYQKYATKDNDVTAGFLLFGSYPNFNRPVATKSLGIIFVPFYAKVSVLSKSIMYFDMSVGLNYGTTDYFIETEKGGVDASTSHFGLDITQTLFLTQHVAIRFDIRNKWSTQDQKKYQIISTAPESSRDLGSTKMQDTSMLIGLTYFF